LRWKLRRQIEKSFFWRVADFCDIAGCGRQAEKKKHCNSQNKTQTSLSEINMIPFIDVVLVLLIIFYD